MMENKKKPEADPEKVPSLLDIDIHMNTGDLYDYMLHHAYTSVAGILGTCFGLVALVIYLDKRQIVYLVFGLIIILYLPITLYQKALMQLKMNPVFKQALSYRFTEEGYTVSQNEVSQSIAWKDCTKAISTKRSLVIYTGNSNASIFPRRELGGDVTTLMGIISGHMEPSKVKIRF